MPAANRKNGPTNPSDSNTVQQKREGTAHRPRTTKLKSMARNKLDQLRMKAAAWRNETAEELKEVSTNVIKGAGKLGTDVKTEVTKLDEEMATAFHAGLDNVITAVRRFREALDGGLGADMKLDAISNNDRDLSTTPADFNARMNSYGIGEDFNIPMGYATSQVYRDETYYAKRTPVTVNGQTANESMFILELRNLSRYKELVITDFVVGEIIAMMVPPGVIGTPRINAGTWKNLTGSIGVYALSRSRPRENGIISIHKTKKTGDATYKFLISNQSCQDPTFSIGAGRTKTDYLIPCIREILR